MSHKDTKNTQRTHKEENVHFHAVWSTANSPLLYPEIVDQKNVQIYPLKLETYEQ